MLVCRRSPISKSVNILNVPITQDQLDRVMNRYETKELIQDIIPDVPAPLREFLISGITPEEWDEMYGVKDDLEGSEEEENDEPIKPF